MKFKLKEDLQLDENYYYTYKDNNSDFHYAFAASDDSAKRIFASSNPNFYSLGYSIAKLNNKSLEALFKRNSSYNLLYGTNLPTDVHDLPLENKDADRSFRNDSNKLGLDSIITKRLHATDEPVLIHHLGKAIKNISALDADGNFSERNRNKDNLYVIDSADVSYGNVTNVNAINNSIHQLFHHTDILDNLNNSRHQIQIPFYEFDRSISDYKKRTIQINII